MPCFFCPFLISLLQVADTVKPADPAKGSTKPYGKPTSSKVIRSWNSNNYCINIFKFSLLQAAAATTNSGKSVSESCSSKVEHPTIFSKL